MNKGPTKRTGNKKDQKPARRHKIDRLHGVTLEALLTSLVEKFGWEEMGKIIDIKCFTNDPSIKSSLKFLRNNLWARTKVERLYLKSLPREKKKEPGTGSQEPEEKKD